MPQNLTNIANSALVKLGANQVNSLAETTREATLCSSRIVAVVHRLLRDHPWRFAMAFVALAPTTDPAVERWAYRFQLPSDCLRIHGLTTGGTFPSAYVNYEIIGQQIYADTDDLFLRYVCRMVENIESPAQLPDDFADAAAAYLAYEISPSLTSSLPLREDIYAAYLRALTSARFNGSVESPPMSTNDTGWLDSRIGLTQNLPFPI